MNLLGPSGKECSTDRQTDMHGAQVHLTVMAGGPPPTAQHHIPLFSAYLKSCFFFPEAAVSPAWSWPVSETCHAEEGPSLSGLGWSSSLHAGLCPPSPSWIRRGLHTREGRTASDPLWPAHPPAPQTWVEFGFRVVWKLLQVVLASQVRFVGGEPWAGSFPNLCSRKYTGWDWCGCASWVGDGHWAAG